MISADQIAAMRRAFPGWDDMTIRRHLQQREALARIAEQQRRQRLAQCLGQVSAVRS